MSGRSCAVGNPRQVRLTGWPVRTWVKPESRRDEVYELLRAEIEKGRQVYVIYPLVEESEKVDLKAATEMADHLAQDVFPRVRDDVAARR